MNNNGFIFDWSGTLSNNFHCFVQVCNSIFIELGKEPIHADEIRSTFTLPYMKFWNLYFPDLTKEKQCELYEKFIHQTDEPELFENVKEILQHLYEMQYKLFIVSSDPLSKLLPEITQSGVSHLITKIDGGVHEKDVVIAELTRTYNLNKNLTYYIGDTSGDVEAGKMAGVKTIGITWGFQNRTTLTQSYPDFVIDDIKEIKNIFKAA